MAITRDPDFPVEIAQLMQSFSRCAEGHSTIAVLEAAANLLVAAIGAHSRAAGEDVSAATSLAAQIGRDLPTFVAKQWDRRPQPTDIPVPQEAN